MTEVKSENIIKFKNPYEFEGKKYTELDLSGLENLSGQDLIDADNTFNSSGQFSIVPQIAIGYSFIIAANVTKHPLEFFKNLPASEAMKVRNIVMGFLNN